MGLLDDVRNDAGNFLGGAAQVVTQAGEAAGQAAGRVVETAVQIATTAVGAVGIDTGQEEETRKATASNRIESYNVAIAKAKAAPKNYDELAVLWRKFVVSRVLEQRKLAYKDLALSEEQYQKMAEIDADAYRSRLSDEQYREQLDELHQAAVDAAAQQLEYERDNPAANGPAPKKENNRGFAFEDELAHFLFDRVVSNIEGAANERGDAAKFLRGTIGISVEDIQKYGILGGENSYLRKIVPTWSDNGGLLGGEGSFFRKNLGLSW